MANNSENEWMVFDYEVDMWRKLMQLVFSSETQLLSLTINNALVESLVLHTRMVVGMLISKENQKDDINLERLDSKFNSRLVGKLSQLYGSSSDSNSACHVFNKMAMHPTTWRGTSFDYAPFIELLHPTIELLLDEVDCYRKSQGTASCGGGISYGDIRTS